MRLLRDLVIFGTFFFAAGCGEEKTVPAGVANAAAPSAGPNRTASAATIPVDKTDGAMVVSGPIIVEHQIEVMAQRDGLVSRIYFDSSARVKAGTLLAQLDDRQLNANLEAARAKTRGIEADLKNWKSEAEVIKADYVRAQHLWDLGLTSEEQLQHAKYKAESEDWDIRRVTESLNTAKQEERSLELEVEKTKVTAPFTALVARRYVREGQSVVKGDRLFWITAEAPLLMRFTLPEKYFGRLKRGEQLPVTPADAPNEKHMALVKEVSAVVDPASGTFEVLTELKGERGSLRPGMTASVRLEGPR